MQRVPVESPASTAVFAQEREGVSGTGRRDRGCWTWVQGHTAILVDFGGPIRPWRPFLRSSSADEVLGRGFKASRGYASNWWQDGESVDCSRKDKAINWNEFCLTAEGMAVLRQTRFVKVKGNRPSREKSTSLAHRVVRSGRFKKEQLRLETSHH